MRKTFSIVLRVAAAIVGGAASAQAQMHDFHIAGGSLKSALDVYARQSDRQLIYRADEIGDASSHGANGAMGADRALKALLDGSGFHSRVDAGGAIAIVRNGAPMRPSSGEANAGSAAADYESADIVVTAQKRAERLRDVPLPISVVAGRELDRSTSDGVNDVLRTMPGVSTITAAQGGTTQLSIRGVASGGPLFAGSSPIAYYLDGLPFSFVSSAVVPDANAYDLERVEVLRGPQGTLYGASALNGVVRILTHDADLNIVSGKVRGLVSDTEHGGINYRGDASVNVPIVEGKLAVRATVGFQNLGGWIDKPNDPDANDSKIRTYRFKINAAPAERLTMGASVWLSRSHFGSPAYGRADLVDPVIQPEPISTKYDLYGFKLGYDFGSFSATSNTSYLNFKNDSFFALSTAANALRSETLLKMNTFNEEVNLASTSDGPWKWTAGGMYKLSHESQSQPILGLFPFPLASRTRSESYAVFGELTRQFFDGKVKLTAGVRYFVDKITSTPISTFTAPSSDPASTSTFHKASPRVVLNWHPERTITVYASYSEGYRSGGTVSTTIRTLAPNFPPLKPDNLKNYEIGSKGSLLAGMLDYDAALYYVDWNGIQQALLVNIGAVNVQALVNSKSGSGFGGELGLTLKPVRRLTLSGGFAWSGLTIDSSVETASGVTLFPKGARLSLSPKYTASGSVAYRLPLGGGYDGRFSGSVNYISRTATRNLDTAANALQISAGDAIATGALSFAIESPAHWVATVFVDNVTDTNKSPLNDFVGFTYLDQRIRPRTFGTQFQYRF